MVHDVFGYWTLPKGKLEINENIEEGTKREIKRRNWFRYYIEEKLGDNEYIATHPEKGKTFKKVVYFLAHSEYKELVLENSGGLDNARWFEMSEVPRNCVFTMISFRFLLRRLKWSIKKIINPSSRQSYYGQEIYDR